MREYFGQEQKREPLIVDGRVPINARRQRASLGRECLRRDKFTERGGDCRAVCQAAHAPRIGRSDALRFASFGVRSHRVAVERERPRVVAANSNAPAARHSQADRGARNGASAAGTMRPGTASERSICSSEAICCRITIASSTSCSRQRPYARRADSNNASASSNRPCTTAMKPRSCVARTASTSTFALSVVRASRSASPISPRSQCDIRAAVGDFCANRRMDATARGPLGVLEQRAARASVSRRPTASA